MEFARVQQPLQIIVGHLELQVHLGQKLSRRVVSWRDDYLSRFANLVGSYIRETIFKQSEVTQICLDVLVVE